MLCINAEDFKKLSYLSNMAHNSRETLLRHAKIMLGDIKQEIALIENNLHQLQNRLSNDKNTSIPDYGASVRQIEKRRVELEKLNKEILEKEKEIEKFSKKIEKDKLFLKRINKLAEIINQIENMKNPDELIPLLQDEFPGCSAFAEYPKNQYENMAEFIKSKFGIEGINVLLDHIDSLVAEK